MKKVLILGASGQIARWAIAALAEKKGVAMTLLARNAKRLRATPNNATVVEGDVLDERLLARVVGGQDIVYANLTGDDIDQQAQAIITAMNAAKVRRLVFVTSLGILDEVPGKFGTWNRRQIGAYLPPFRRASDAIEASGLDYTVLRPAWLTDVDEVDYETTEKGQPFRGTEVSRKSVAALIAAIIDDPRQHLNANVGVNKPGTDGDKPSFY